MEQVFSYISKSLKSGLYVGVGFVGLGIVTALLTNNFGGPLSEISTCSSVSLTWAGLLPLLWPIVLGVIVGALIGAVAQLDIKKVLFLGVTMGAVMELIPRITKLFIDGLKPIAEKTQEVVQKKWAGKKVYIGMSPALVIGHPTTLVASLILIPLALLMAVALPGNEFLPLASLAGMFYVFVMVLPYTKGNVVKTLIVGVVAVGIGLWFVTDMAPAFTQAAQTVYAQTQDPAAKIPEGFQAGALDFASSLFGWVIYKCVNNLAYVGMGLLSVIAVVMVWINRMRIVREEKATAK